MGRCTSPVLGALPAFMPPVRDVTYRAARASGPVEQRGPSARRSHQRIVISTVTAWHCSVEPLGLYFPLDVSPNALAILVSALQIASDRAILPPQRGGDAAHPGRPTVPLQELRFALLQISLDRAFPVRTGKASAAVVLSRGYGLMPGPKANGMGVAFPILLAGASWRCASLFVEPTKRRRRV
jgi:hypothetical protein